MNTVKLKNKIEKINKAQKLTVEQFEITTALEKIMISQDKKENLTITFNVRYNNKLLRKSLANTNQTSGLPKVGNTTFLYTQHTISLKQSATIKATAEKALKKINIIIKNENNGDIYRTIIAFEQNYLDNISLNDYGFNGAKVQGILETKGFCTSKSLFNIKKITKESMDLSIAIQGLNRTTLATYDFSIDLPKNFDLMKVYDNQELLHKLIAKQILNNEKLKNWLQKITLQTYFLNLSA